MTAMFPALRRTVGGLPRSFWYLTVGTFINRTGIFVFPFLTLFLTSQRGLSVERATEVVSLYGIGSFISQFAGGFLSDRLGRRTTMLISLFVSAVLLLLLGTLSDVNLVALTTLLIGLFTDLYRPAASALVVDVVRPEDRARAFSIRYWAINLGAAVGLSLGGLLAQSNFALLFIGDSLTTAGFGLIVLFFIRDSRLPIQAREPDRDIDQPEESETARTEKRIASHHTRHRLLFVFLYMILILAAYSIYVQSTVTMPLAMTAKGLSPANYGTAVALNGVLIVLITIPINRYFENRPPFRTMAISVLLLGVGFGLYAIAGTLALFTLGVIIWTLGELIAAPIGPTIMADIAPPHQRGLYQGLFGSGFGMAAFVGPILGGWIYGHWGNAALWIGCLIVSGIVAATYLVLLAPMYRRLQHKRATTEDRPV